MSIELVYYHNKLNEKGGKTISLKIWGGAWPPGPPGSATLVFKFIFESAIATKEMMRQAVPGILYTGTTLQFAVTNTALVVLVVPQ